MEDHARGRKVHVGPTANFIAPWCNNRGGKTTGPYKCCKKA
jgi:hypothetical protein